MRTGSVAILAALLVVAAGCAHQPSAPGDAGKSPGSVAQSAAPPETGPAPTDPAEARSAEDAHREQMQSLHHQGHSQHEFRAIHNMDEMHRMGGVPDMPPLDDLKAERSPKTGTSQ
jgi:hypothetical protein